MKKLLVLLFATSALWSDTLVSGSSTYATNIVPFNSETSFNLVLTGGDITSLDVFHGYQIGAKGNSDQNFTTGFIIQPVPPMEVNVIGIATGFAIVIDGVTYSQASSSLPIAGITPPAGSSITVTLTLTPISGTNIVNTSQNSTATGLFAVTGSVDAAIENGTYLNPLPGGTNYTAIFSGYADFNGSYVTNGSQLTETYTYISSVAPEPGTAFCCVSLLGSFGFIRVIRRRPVPLP